MQQASWAIWRARMILVRRLDVALTTSPAVGSAAETELADKTQAYAYDLAAVAMRATLDHLFARTASSRLA